MTTQRYNMGVHVDFEILPDVQGLTYDACKQELEECVKRALSAMHREPAALLLVKKVTCG